MCISSSNLPLLIADKLKLWICLATKILIIQWMSMITSEILKGGLKSKRTISVQNY